MKIDDEKIQAKLREIKESEEKRDGEGPEVQALVEANENYISEEKKFQEALVVVKKMEEKINDFREKIKEEMKARGIKKIKTDNLTITYVEPTERQIFDSKKFQQEHPEMFPEFLKISKVKENLRIKLEDGK